MSDPVTAACSVKYKAAHDSGPRQGSSIKYAVIHCTEGSTAEGAASWLENPKSTGSANVVCDDKECFRTVADLRVPWAAPPLNKAGWHIELAGFAHWGREDWLKHEKMLRRAAYKTALRCRRYGIPVRQVGPIGLLLGRKGITSHNAVSKAFRMSDHSDPGPGFPWTVFIGYVEEAVAVLDNL